MSGLQQVVPGGILHGDFLTGQAGKPCNVAAAAQDAQRAAVGVIKGKGRAGALGPGEDVYKRQVLNAACSSAVVLRWMISAVAGKVYAST